MGLMEVGELRVASSRSETTIYSNGVTNRFDTDGRDHLKGKR